MTPTERAELDHRDIVEPDDTDETSLLKIYRSKRILRKTENEPLDGPPERANEAPLTK